MIVRIMGRGQWVLEPEALIALNEIDEAVEKAVDAGDAEAMRAAVERLVASVQDNGVPVPDDVLAESDLVLPDTDATVEEVRALLDSTAEFYGLIPDADQFEMEADPVEPGADVDGQVSEAPEADTYGDGAPLDADADTTPELVDALDSLQDVPAEPGELRP